MNKSVIAAALALVGVPAFAEIEPIVIVGNKAPTELKDTVQTIRVISKSDIEKSGSTTVIEALRKVAGVSLYDTLGNGTSTTVAVRGFSNDSAQNTAILLNGNQIDFPTKEGGQLDLVDLGQIEQIEVLYGSGGVLYGDGATGGAINIVTSKPTEDSHTIRLSTGSFGLGSAAYFGSVEGENTNISYSLSGMTRDGYRKHGEYDEHAASISIGHQATEDVSLSTLVYGRKNSRATQGATSASSLDSDRRSGGAIDDYDFDQFGLIQTANIDSKLGSTVLTATHNTSEQVATGANAAIIDTEKHALRLEQSWSTQLTQNTLGLENKQSDYSAYGSTKSADSVALFARSDIFIADSIWSLGARHESSSYDVGSNRNFNNSAFEIGVNKPITERVTLKARADTNYRLPTLDESPLATLQDQTGLSKEVSLVYSGENTFADVSAFQIENTNEISYRFNSSFGGYYESFNLDSSTRRGITAKLKHIIESGLEINAIAEVLDAKYSDGEIAGKRIPLVPEYTATVSLTKAIASDQNIQLSARYESQKPLQDDYGNLEAPLDEFVEWDLAYGRQFNEQTRIALTVFNIFDHERYSWGVYSGGAAAFVPNEGRDIRATLTHTF